MYVSRFQISYPNLVDLAGTVYSSLDVADGSQDPYTLVEARHLPSVKTYDVAVSFLAQQ